MERHWTDSMFVWTCILLKWKLARTYEHCWSLRSEMIKKIPAAWLKSKFSKNTNIVLPKKAILVHHLLSSHRHNGKNITTIFIADNKLVNYVHRTNSHRSEMADKLVVVRPQWLHNDCGWHRTNCRFKIGVFASRTISPGENREHNDTPSVTWI